MKKQIPLFNKRVLRNIVRTEIARGIQVTDLARRRVEHWAAQLQRGVLDRMSESSAEQTFNSEIFGTVLGYEQIGQAVEASLVPKRTGPSGRDTPDFVLGRFDVTAGVEEWVAVGEIKNAKTDLDQPQVGRATKETPVEQAFRYAVKGKPGVEWILVTNFREIRLYKNGYIGAYHAWQLEELTRYDRLTEFYILLKPEGLLNRGREPVAARCFRETISAGRDLTEGFYGLYKAVQQALISELGTQRASTGLSITELYGKTHKLLNRVLFIAFCEKHPAELLPHDTLRQVVNRARTDGSPGAYWREYKALFEALNVGGGPGKVALNAFNGGLFARDVFFDAIEIPDVLFRRRFRTGRGRRQSLEITGIFGFDVYDFAEDLNVQALGAIFEQSLKDIPKGDVRVRGVGETEVTTQETGGVYYTPREITSHLVRGALNDFFQRFDAAAQSVADNTSITKVSSPRSVMRRRKTVYYIDYAARLRTLKVIDPACGSGAFLAEVLEQLLGEYDKVNRAMAELVSVRRQMSLMDLDRMILRENLHGRDILPESVEISRLSIWLHTAKRGERLESLDQTIAVGDSLRCVARETYDVVVGNPPWGADLDGWTAAELANRFPNSGAEADSYAIFINQAWEMLKVGGVLAFIVPNSWLTVNGYAGFRGWLLRHFELIEVTNVWKIFSDVNHDASMVIARKRSIVADEQALKGKLGAHEFLVHSVERGISEGEKLKRLARGQWAISHQTSHRFQYDQPKHRFEVIYRPNVAQELDQIAARCQRLDAVADVTVGIQVYHHTKVSKEFIRQRRFHSKTREGADWHHFIDANDVQRYYAAASTTQWLHFNDKLRDKRELEHYRQPRILVQQIFWRRLAAVLERPIEPKLYLNTLFAIYNARGVSLECLLGLINSRFISGSYERRANRLFGDKFPKVSKIDLASVPIPKMSATMMRDLGAKACGLQAQWQGLRDLLREASADLTSVRPGASLSDFRDFSTLSEVEFRSRATAVYGGLAPAQSAVVRDVYRKTKAAADTRWHIIESGESELEELVRNVYRARDDVYREVIEVTPRPTIEWALRS